MINYCHFCFVDTFAASWKKQLCFIASDPQNHRKKKRTNNNRAQKNYIVFQVNQLITGIQSLDFVFLNQNHMMFV